MSEEFLVRWISHRKEIQIAIMLSKSGFAKATVQFNQKFRLFYLETYRREILTLVQLCSPFVWNHRHVWTCMHKANFTEFHYSIRDNWQVGLCVDLWSMSTPARSSFKKIWVRKVIIKIYVYVWSKLSTNLCHSWTGISPHSLNSFRVEHWFLLIQSLIHVAHITLLSLQHTG